jgi:hypothetical protein
LETDGDPEIGVPAASDEELPEQAHETQEAQAQSGREALAHAVARYRDMVAAQPGLVPEMVSGSTIEEVDASARAARQAYEQISRRIAVEYEAHVPAGNPARSGSSAAEVLRPEDKIALGLRGK